MKGFDLGWVGLIAFDLICFEEDPSTQLGCIYIYVVGDMRIGAFGCYLDFSEVDTSKWGTKAVMTGIHVVFVGALFALDSDLRRETVIHPWYTALYLLLFLLSLFQYFYTAGSSPGYVLDVLNSNMVNEADIKRRFDFVSSSASSSQRPGTLAIDLPGYRSPTYGITRVRGLPAQATETTETVPIFSNSGRTWSCPYCHCWQPPRSKHCHDCEKCVLRFDHHCVWLGTCVGQGNHCRFWWYLFEESVLCAWTAVMYGMLIRKDVSKAWWRAGIEIILIIGLLFCLIILLMLLSFHTYLILTNQTTYELIRRRRIPYLRGIPDKVHPFSRGLLRNIYEFCCSWDSFYKIDSLPTPEELEEKARPYTFWDIISCRCCC